LAATFSYDIYQAQTAKDCGFVDISKCVNKKFCNGEIDE
jgi:hypothetical protein